VGFLFIASELKKEIEKASGTILARFKK